MKFLELQVSYEKQYFILKLIKIEGLILKTIIF